MFGLMRTIPLVALGLATGCASTADTSMPIPAEFEGEPVVARLDVGGVT